MAAENICPNCGASNDPVFANCLFCNTQLIKVELSTLSSEAIIENCGLWIGRLAGANSEEGVRLSTGEKGLLSDKFHQLTIGEVKGYVDKYMILLETRTIGNPSLEGILNRMNERYKDAVESFKKNTKNYWLIVIICGVAVLGIAALSIWAYNMGWLNIKK
ncbi:MAG: hypothetical protein WCK02_14640 [Bacteroidota bacterium]